MHSAARPFEENKNFHTVGVLNLRVRGAEVGPSRATETKWQNPLWARQAI